MANKKNLNHKNALALFENIVPQHNVDFNQKALARRLTHSLGGLHPLAMPHPCRDSESSSLAAAAAALVALRIGPPRNCQQEFIISYSNHGPNLL